MPDGLRLAISVLTRIPCRAERTDRDAVGSAMAWASLVGVMVGGLGSIAYTLTRLPLAPYVSRLLPAAIALAAIAVVTGGLHLDGLADSADALGVRGDHEAVRAAMKAPGIGAFGAAALVFVALIDVAAIAVAGDYRLAVTALVTGCVAGRLAVTWSCRPSVAAATGTGLGAWVADTVPLRRAMLATAFAIAVTAGWAALWRRDDPGPVIALACGALVAGVTTGELVRRLVARRTGGLTGDVLGAVVETGAMAAYVVVALGARAVS
ncbi:MAG: adenosylcobinamide-GDP ribazoletransferase [Frankiaceae bacterium]|jgi:adenosylcobinamide-GDP ribazoletransferase|nr:adenosylcobinamide-GDP ribazoletransferase [Frankiaceae bacterium]